MVPHNLGNDCRLIFPMDTTTPVRFVMAIEWTDRTTDIGQCISIVEL